MPILPLMVLPTASFDPAVAGRLIARAASFLLLAGAALAAQVPSGFSLGDGRERVRQVQGSADLVERLASQGVEHWSFDGATVTFDLATGRVIEWNDPRRVLRVALRSTPGTRDSVLALGAGIGDIARLFGTPWAVTRDGTRRQMYLAFGRSVIRVDIASGRVTGWVRRDAAMRVRASDDSLAHAALAARAPASLAIAADRTTARALPARFALASVTVRDATGDQRLAPREFADITLRVRNVGASVSPAVPAHVVRSAGLVLIAGAPDTVWLPALAPGDSTDVVVTAYATGAVASPEIALVILAPGSAVRLAARVQTVPPEAAGGATSTRDDLASGIPAAATRNGDALAVIIGIGSYQRLPDARFADDDAALMRAYAVQALGVPDDGAHLMYRRGADASGSELRRLLGDRGWLARRTTDNTDILVYFAGHGAMDDAERRPHLLPADGDANYVGETGLDLYALLDRLARLPARSITVLLDACFSGLGRSGRPLVQGTRASVVSIEHPALVRRNMAVLVASRGAQVAGDLPAERHGAFTWFVARGLRGAADDDGDRTITVAELGRYVEREVTRSAAALDREQQPLTIARDSLRAVARLAPR
ncbi:MAG: caspase family protein [Gemmatimonadaceae bacterium]|nr:caspase family protein [Gemmatimonadaceae bacterium]